MDTARTKPDWVNVIYKIITNEYPPAFHTFKAKDYLCVTSFKRVFYHAELSW